MLALIKARLRDPRTWTVLASMLLMGLGAYVGPMVGIKGAELRALLGPGGAIGILIAYVLKAPKDADAHIAAKKAASVDPDAQPSGDSGESDGADVS